VPDWLVLYLEIGDLNVEIGDLDVDVGYLVIVVVG